MPVEVKTTIEGVNDTSYPSQAKWDSYAGEDLLLIGFNGHEGRLVAALTMEWFLKDSCWVKNSKGELSAWWKLNSKWFESQVYNNTPHWHDYEAEGIADLRYVQKGAIYHWGRKHYFHYKGRRYSGEQINFGWDFDGIIRGCRFRDMEEQGMAGRFDEKLFRRYVLGLGNWVIGCMFEFDSQDNLKKSVKTHSKLRP